MRELPTGTVTFLFTDIEGSTRLLHELGERAAGPVRVRIGVHTGEPTVTDEGYVGADVHRGARICAAGHGGRRVGALGALRRTRQPS